MKMRVLMLVSMLYCILLPSHVSAVMSAASLNGSYKINGLDAALFRHNSGSVWNDMGDNDIRVTFNGAGSCTVNYSWKEYLEGTNQVFYETDQGSGSCSYTVAADGAMTITSGEDVIDGWQVSADGTSLLKSGLHQEPASDNSGTFHYATIMVGIKLGTAMNKASLNGKYKIGELEPALFRSNGGYVSSVVGGNDVRVTFNGAGSCTYTSAWKEYYEGYNQVFANVEPPESGNCTYTVAANGATTLTIDGTYVMSGWYVSANGNNLLRSEVIQESSDDNSGTMYLAHLMTGVKLGNAMSAASLNGHYQIGGLGATLFRSNAGPVTNNVGTDDIRVAFDGAGSCNYTSSWEEYVQASSQVTYDTEPQQTGSCSYTVAADGATAITISEGTVVEGWHVSANGNNLLKVDLFQEQADDNSGTMYTGQMMFGIKVPAPPAGTCGSANNDKFTMAPTANLCSAGTASSVSGGGPWTWTCTGSGGGSVSNCSAGVHPALRDGNANGQGSVDVFDALLALQYALSLVTHNQENDSKYLAAADIYPLDENLKPKGDGNVDILDALAILQRAVGLLSW